MLTVDKFKQRLRKTNSPDWLHVAADDSNEKQLYIIGNGGMGTTISMPIERFGAEIKGYISKKLEQGELVIDNKPSLLLEKGIFVRYLVKPADVCLLQKQTKVPASLYQGLYIWQKNKQLSDDEVINLLGISLEEFMQLKENQYEINDKLLNKISSITKISKVIWKNYLVQSD
ncbi:MAG: hypothetical protein OCD00_03695 [Colwellia sp.]